MQGLVSDPNKTGGTTSIIQQITIISIILQAPSVCYSISTAILFGGYYLCYSTDARRQVFVIRQTRLSYLAVIIFVTQQTLDTKCLLFDKHDYLIWQLLSLLFNRRKGPSVCYSTNTIILFGSHYLYYSTDARHQVFIIQQTWLSYLAVIISASYSTDAKLQVFVSRQARLSYLTIIISVIQQISSTRY